MELSVVVSTLNGREHLNSCLDALDAGTSGAEIVVVNGPSTDGTSGMVADRDDVSVLVEIAERNDSVARNAGYRVTTGDVVAFVGDDCEVDPRWGDALDRAVDAGADVVTGPTGGRRDRAVGRSGHRVGGQTVTFFEGDNVAFDRCVLESIDGFDENLTIGADRDCAHRLARLGVDVIWSGDLSAGRIVGTDGGQHARSWGEIYRAYTYRHVKNYGLRPTVLGRVGFRAVADGTGAGRDVFTGNTTPSDALRNGRSVATNVAIGLKDGLGARRDDPTSRRNPHGASSRGDRVVRLEDWR